MQNPVFEFWQELSSFAVMPPNDPTCEKIHAFIAEYLAPGEQPGEALTAISNAYHQWEAAIYDDAHPDIWLNSSYLKEAIKEYILDNVSKPLTILDMGCGTGFVTEVILSLHQPEKIDHIVLYDLSKEMVAAAKRKFADTEVELEFLSGQNDLQKLAGRSFDLVITNAVLHHIPDLQAFTSMISGFVKPAGIFIACHEPNALHYKNEELQLENRNFRSFKKWKLKTSVGYWLFKLGLKKSPGKTPYMDIVSKTNETLLKLGVLQKPIPPLYLPKLIDIHVPITDFDQQPWGEPGFSPGTFTDTHLPGFTVVATKTYSHLKDNLVAQYSKWKQKAQKLQTRFPNDGADLIMVLRKKA